PNPDLGYAPGSGANGAACARDADCGADFTCAICQADASTGLPKNRARSCGAPGAAGECTFGSWTACTVSGACGNGKIEGNEQCDDGAANAPNARCLPTCRLNVCGDNQVLSGTEQCDNGSQNGTRCSPAYGATCNYCKNDCTIETISGAYCGNGT